jgi:hypothetical protein
VTGPGETTPSDSSFADEAFAAAASAYADTRASWELAVRAGIESLFRFLAARPRQTSACVVSGARGGPDALAGQERLIERFVELLQPGFAVAPTPPPPIVAEAIGGGIYAIVRGHVLERRLDELPAAAPDATFVALSPFLGRADAAELANATRV